MNQSPQGRGLLKRSFTQEGLHENNDVYPDYNELEQFVGIVKKTKAWQRSFKNMIDLDEKAK